MSVEDFIFRVGADVSQFDKSIKDIEAELKKWQNSLKTATGSAIVEANKNINDLQTSMVNLRNVGLDKLPQAANKGAASLNALGQVARDAPFGFIAIQNNLPILFDQFGALSKQSGGVINGLKSIGSALIGPAGVTFAIGGAISAITVLVQKYGSFGGALNAIFSIQTKLNDKILESAESYEKFNKEVKTSNEITSQSIAGESGTIAKIQALVKIVNDQTISYQERNTALNQLKDINKDYFGNLDLEKTKYSDLSTQVINYINSLKQAAVIKGFEQAIANTSVQLEDQRETLKLLKEQLDEVGRKPITFIGKSDRVDTRELDAAQLAFDNQKKIVTELENKLAGYNKKIEESIILQNQIQVSIDATTEANKKAANALDKKIDAQNKAIEADKKWAEQSRKSYEENADFVRQQEISSGNFTTSERLVKANTNIIKGWFATIRKGSRENLLKNIIPKSLPTSQNIPINTEAINQKAKLASEQLKTLKEEANLASSFNLVNDTFFNPIQSAFENFLNTGRFAFKEFGQAVLKAINQIVAKIIATGIIALLFTILSGGFGAAAGGFAGGLKTVGSIIGASLGFGGGRRSRVQDPTFGGVSAGGLQMAGAVNLSLRGSDLVGAINRTNATINRVG